MKSIILLLLMISCTEKNSLKKEFSLLHYNVKELRAYKVNNPNNLQVNNLAKLLDKYSFDILSINEVEYKKGILQSLKSKLKPQALNYEVLIKANTGNNSTAEKPDLVNFGKVPGEYSNGALMKFKPTNKVIIRDLLWRDFFKDDFSSYELAPGKAIPEKIELFDKSFSDITFEFNEREIHLILLHTVPSYGFGNKKSINFLRNQRQLEFLKWYINRDGKSLVKQSITPLKKLDSFIIVGDLNVDINAKTQGSKVLKEIIEVNNSWIPLSEMDYTHPSPKLMLDYIITSKDIITTQGKILKDAPSDVSDHLPIFAKFKLKEQSPHNK